jgi:hypothetical protein
MSQMWVDIWSNYVQNKGFWFGDIVSRFKKMGGANMGVNIVIFNLEHTIMLTPRYFYLNVVVGRK